MFKKFFQIRTVIFLIGTFLVSGWVSCTELNYLIWGKEAAATIKSVNVTKTLGTRRRAPRDVLAVKYEWTDAGYGERRDVMNRELDWTVPSDGIIQIAYLPGVKGSRLAGERNLLGPIVFIVMAAVMIFVIVQTWREGSRGSS